MRSPVCYGDGTQSSEGLIQEAGSSWGGCEELPGEGSYSKRLEQPNQHGSWVFLLYTDAATERRRHNREDIPAIQCKRPTAFSEEKS